PEGTRSQTEEHEFRLKRGIHYLIERHPLSMVVPVFLRGLGKALPKGVALVVAFNSVVIIDHPLPFEADAEIYVESLESRYQLVLKRCITKERGTMSDE